MSKKATVTFDLTKDQLVQLIVEVDDAIVNNNDEDVPELIKLLEVLNAACDKTFPEVPK